MEENFELYNFFKTPKELKQQAKEGLKYNRGKSMFINLMFWFSKLCFFGFLTLLLVALFNLNNPLFNLSLFIILAIILMLISALTYGPLKISQCKHSINMVENTHPQASDIAYGFKKKYFRNVFYGISLVFLYLFNLIMLIFPFVSKYIHYQISGYILAENENFTVGEAFRESTKLSKGFNKKYLKVLLSFAGKFALCIISVYVFSLWIRPYFNATIYCYYKDIKK